ncbi:arf-GAP domain and FG repeat-containing protein 1b isoform X1 [Colossoma macropomum]|uniref:arf-GAP domain and FG repeat-containing protein 1b isoform X1 n=1 Tax=Colossoma macropomum TaxID=42526 RepID=UPI001864DA02|nr:arf-GAP domain and FG repeat-containing protein 1b isoform X1 [Colossoma macropomum]
MAAKRRQEEQHLKLLREMLALPPNRSCFDCAQRGPTYANMTVGSFVCTTCSGILRGLNPPHRVKSISMTTFTQQEIDFLQKHSNEVCKHIWLGLYDDRSSAVPDFREPQKVKEFLQEKYEKKRWYVPPEQAKVLASVQASISGSSASSTSSTPEVLPQPIKTLHLNKTPSSQSQSPVSSRAQSQPAGQEKKFDLLSDLGGDIFASHSAGTSNFANFAHFNRPSAQNSSVPEFAKFDSFGKSSVSQRFHPSSPSSSPSSLQPPQTGGSVSVPPLPSMPLPTAPPGLSGQDRYAALAELDSALSSTHKASQGVFDAVPGPAAAQPQPVLPSMQQGFTAAPSTNPFLASGMAPEPMSTNPFQTNGRSSASGSMSMPAGFGNTPSYCLPTSFSGTFQQPFPGQGPFHPLPPAAYTQPNGGFPAYGQAKPPMTYGQPAMSSNPFMSGAPAGPYPTGGSSTNPFL